MTEQNQSIGSDQLASAHKPSPVPVDSSHKNKSTIEISTMGSDNVFKNVFKNNNSMNEIKNENHNGNANHTQPQPNSDVIKINEWHQILAKYKDSIYYDFLQKSKFIDISPCQFVEPIFNCKINCKIVLTNFCILIDPVENDPKILYQPNYFIVPYPCIDEIKFTGKGNDNSFRNFESSDFDNITILTKDFRSINLTSNNKRKIFRELPNRLFSFNSFQNFYGYSYKEKWEHKCNLSFDLIGEYKRQGIRCEYEHILKETKNANKIPFMIFENISSKQTICETYPKFVIVPSSLTREMLMEVSNFRSLERIPILSYYCRHKNVYLWRGSQCKSGISKARSSADEFFLSLLHDPNKYCSVSDMFSNFEKKKYIDVHLYDARDKLAVFGNMISGKGTENSSFYKNCQISFNNLGNMNTVQASFQKLTKALTNLESDHYMESKEWTEMLMLILQLSSKILKSMHNGFSAFVHCSDGWDRTSQVVSLVQICVDPHYRTINGFIDLIMKEFVYFGHQFGKRNGIGCNERSSWSPIWIQFVHCLYQIQKLSPERFEFNENFLIDIGFFAYSGVFGEFMANNFIEREKFKLDIKTVSLYEYFDMNKQMYLNPGFKDDNSSFVQIPVRMYNIEFWKNFFYYFIKKERSLDFELPYF